MVRGSGIDFDRPCGLAGPAQRQAQRWIRSCRRMGFSLNRCACWVAHSHAMDLDQSPFARLGSEVAAPFRSPPPTAVAGKPRAAIARAFHGPLPVRLRHDVCQHWRPQVKARGDAVVKGLAECQAKLGSGYLSAYPETFFDRVERRQQVWAPYFTLHKIFLPVWRTCMSIATTNRRLEVAKNMEIGLSLGTPDLPTNRCKSCWARNMAA